MRKVSIQIGIAAMIMIVACFIYRICIGNRITDVMMNPGFEAHGVWEEAPVDLIRTFDTEGVVEIEKVRIHDQYMEIRLRALGKGNTGCNYKMRGSDELFQYSYYRVGLFNTITCDNTYFTGLEFYIPAVGVFLLVTCLSFLIYFIRLKGGAIYSYLAIFSVGMALFTGAGAMGILLSFVRHTINPYVYNLANTLRAISQTASSCMTLLTIPMLIFAIAMIISNIELLKHEKLRFANVLGILIPVAMILGEAIPFFVGFIPFMGSFEEYRLREIIENTYNTIYVYFECMLAGSVICGIRSVKHRVAPDRDFIIILGCKFRNDGSLTPLLQGRCDAAVNFWRKQKERTGKQAIMITSGGQGKDEPMPEAEAMARYLLTCDIPESAIIRETESKNTYQNMQFSKKIIEERMSSAKVAYATTNYHVFRSGLWAALAGLPAEGIGGATKWWFWPNAFMRECVGLMANRVRQELVLLLITIMLCILLSYLTIV